MYQEREAKQAISAAMLIEVLCVELNVMELCSSGKLMFLARRLSGGAVAPPGVIDNAPRRSGG